MARRPARLERAGALTPRDRMWSAIRALAASNTEFGSAHLFSPVEVQFLANLGTAPEAHVHIDTVESYVRALSRAKPPYVELCEERPKGRKRAELAVYFLKRDVGVEAPRVTAEGKPVTQGAANEQMWGVMKTLRDFDTAELADCASHGQVKVSEETAITYARYLERAGYLSIAQQAKPGLQRARYRFNRAKDTGPRAPLVARDKSVMDANTGETVWTPQGGKECRKPT